jgi:hypothetical protein
MTSLNPSHNPFRHSSGRHAQAVHQPSAPSSSFPDDLPISDSDSDSEYGVDEHLRGERRARREGRKRVRAAMPPMPDLRFEQVSGECSLTVESILPCYPIGDPALGPRSDSVVPSLETVDSVRAERAVIPPLDPTIPLPPTNKA